MKKIGFSKLYELDYNLKHIFAVRQHWKEGTTFKMNMTRRTSCLLYFCGCSATYKFDGVELSVPCGSVLYIPEGAIYETNFYDCDNRLPSTMLIEFSLCLPNNEHFCAAKYPCLLKQENNILHISHLFDEITDAYSSSVVPTSKIKSIIYSLLSDLSFNERKKSLYSREFNTIAKGILILENDFKSDVSIKEIADICHVSESTFRRLFKEYTGKSPIDYRIERRISYAKKLLNTGSMSTLQVALETGFDDPAYFCRVFKKKTGITTGEFLDKLKK